MRLVLLVIGAFATLTGLLWVGQGLGYIHWPQSSFMLDQRPWALRGAILTVFGLILLLRSSLTRRRR